MNFYRLLKKNPLKESSREFLSWLADTPYMHPRPLLIITEKEYQLKMEGQPPQEFIGIELELIPEKWY